MHEHVYECIQAWLTALDGMDNDLESLYEGDISLTLPLIINGLTALTFLEDLSHYFRSVPISSVPVKLPLLLVNISTNILKVRRSNLILMAGFNIYLNFYFMAPMPYYFRYIQFNLLVNKLKSRQAVFAIAIAIAIIFTIAGVKYVYAQYAQSLQYSRPGYFVSKSLNRI